MCTLTLIDCENAEPVTLDISSTPSAKIIAAVRERARARKLNFLQADEAVKAALDKYLLVRSLPIAIDCGQRKADSLAEKPRVHSWRSSGDDNRPSAA